MGGEWKEDEKKGQRRGVCVCLCVCVYVRTHVYIYIGSGKIFIKEIRVINPGRKTVWQEAGMKEGGSFHTSFHFVSF